VSFEQQAEDFLSVLIAFRPDRRAGVDLADLGCAQGPVDPPFGLAALLSERGVRAFVAVLEVAVVSVTEATGARYRRADLRRWVTAPTCALVRRRIAHGEGPTDCWTCVAPTPTRQGLL
jgi:hypothetical protein